MIGELKISYERDGVNYSMSCGNDFGDNLPYVLSDMFKRVIDDSCANPDIIIRELADSYGNHIIEE